jgi:outer membrane protein TolC
MAAVILTGCAVGPDYTTPEYSLPASWHSELTDGLIAGPGEPNMLVSWWTALSDPQLSNLVERAVAGNLDLKTTRSRIRESRARRGITEAD